MNDIDILDQLRDALAEVGMETPLAAIIARGHARQHRLRRGLIAAGATASVLLAATVVALGHAAAPADAPRPEAAQLAAFTVSAAPGGATALTLRKGAQYRLDANALRQALADHGVPALVTVGKTCDTNPEPVGLDQVVSASSNPDGAVYLTIDPAAMPDGSELSIGYYPTGTSFALIEASAPLRCASHPPGGQRNELLRPLGPADGPASRPVGAQ
jgi:hypothetical protein